MIPRDNSSETTVAKSRVRFFRKFNVLQKQIFELYNLALIPDDYSPREVRGLLIALHPRGEDFEDFTRLWRHALSKLWLSLSHVLLNRSALIAVAGMT